MILSRTELSAGVALLASLPTEWEASLRRNLDATIAELASRQHGVFTRAQALRVGFSDDQVRYRLTTGRWIALSAGIYAIAGTPLTFHSEVMGKILSAPHGSAAGERTAVQLWKALPALNAPIAIVVPHGSHHSGARQAVNLSHRDVRRVDGIPVTCPARTLVDVAGVLSPEPLEAALDEFLGLGLTSVPAVQTYIADRNLQHRPEAGVLRNLLADRSEGVPQKELERRFLRLIREFGLPKPVKQKPSGPHKIDFAYPELMIAIEVDGWNSHRTPRDLDYDLRRQNRLVLDGWTPVRFTWKQVTRQPELVAAAIREAIQSRRRLIRS